MAAPESPVAQPVPAGSGSSGAGMSPVARLLRRYEAVAITVMLVVAVTRLSGGSFTAAAGSASNQAAGGLTLPGSQAHSGGGTAGGTAGASGAQLGGGSLASGSSDAGGLSLSGSGGGTAGAPSGTAGATGTSGGGTVSGPASAGIGTPAALAAPDCDRATGKIKISFSWRPACVVPWPQGADNGGATAQGVTATTIKIVLYKDQTVNTERNDSDYLAYWQTSVQLFEHFYRMWGRHIVTTVVDQTGSDDASQRADAIAIADLHPFAAVGITSANQILQTELAKRGVIVLANGNVSEKIALQYPGYIWGTNVQPDELVELNAADYVGRRLLGHTAHWAGEADYQVRPRKFAIIHPDTWDMSLFDNEFAKYGAKVADDISYSPGEGNASSWAERAQTIAIKLKTEGITSVIAATDLLFTGPMTQAAAAQSWFPEWITTGYLAQDLDPIAATFNQAEWSHAFGVASIPVDGNQPWPEYWFYQWYWGYPCSAPHPCDGPAQSEAPVLFGGIHGAGPDLTEKTFQAGLFAIPPYGGPLSGGKETALYAFGNHGFSPWTSYNPYSDFDEVYWDPTAVAPSLEPGTETAGHYRHLNGGQRYLPRSWPTGEPAMFNPAGTVDWYNSYAPGDQPPNFPCVGCPSTGG
jgi:hypothetical protein